MRAYKVTAKDGDEVLGTRYAGTQADARTKRDELVEQFKVKKGQVETEETEVPMAKAELLEFINGLAAGSDAVEEDDS
jgi:hypothetical protein